MNSASSSIQIVPPRAKERALSLRLNFETEVLNTKIWHCDSKPHGQHGSAALQPISMADSTPSYREVLSKVNSVLAASGLNDSVWSVRDCDSTLFVRARHIRSSCIPIH
eukprot:5609981-Pleurochrysis_carterae.AAC.1